MATAVTRRDPYTGDKRKTVREGNGSYEYDNKFFKYEGQWKNGKKHGHGKLVFLDGSYYEGMFNMGEIDGFGFRFFAATGCKYQGQFVRGELHGKGRMIWPDGSIYEGQWDHNRRQGFGIMKSIKENLIYKGAYYQNKRQGQGTMIYPKGDRYDGDWHMDKRHGDGDMKYMDGTIYEGQFEDDHFNGVGVMRHCSGVVYNGQWKNGDPVILPQKLVIINPTGKEPLEIIQGQPFSIKVQCVNEQGEVIEVDSGRELRITAGFKHIKAKKGTALFDLIEEYEERPLETPYYEVLQYPLTDFVVEEDETQQEEDQDEEARDDVVEMRELKDGESDVTSRTLSTRKQSVISNLSEETEEAKTIADENTKEREETKEDLKSEVFAGDTKEEESVDNRSEVVTRSEIASQEGQRMQRQPSIVSNTSETPETPMSIASTMTPGAIEPSLDAAPFLPPVLNKRSNKGECEWNNIQLGKAPPRFPPFVALDEEERKTRARQQKQDVLVEEKAREPGSVVEAKRMGRAKHDERYARIGEYVLMVTDVTSPPFMGQTLDPAYLLLKMKRPKREKKPKENKPKWDTSKHIAESMLRN